MEYRERFGFFIGSRVRSGVLVNYSNRGIEVYSPRSLPSQSLTDLRSWSRGSDSAIIAESALNRL
jgi:hypothetical protein